MQKSIFSLAIGPRNITLFVAAAVLIVLCGLTGNAKAATQDNTRAIDSMYECIDTYTKKAQKSTKTSGGEIAFRKSLSKATQKGIAERKDYLLKKERFTDKGLDQRYQKLDALVDAGNKTLNSNGNKNNVVRPKFHKEKIKNERENIFAQLDRRAEIARDYTTPIDKLITNHCETSWGLRVYVVAGRKWQAQTNTDTLNTRNAVAKAYWIAANKPKGKDPAQFDKQISQFQQELDALTIPRTGIVSAGVLNPKDGDAKSAFNKRMYGPQKELREKIVANSQNLKKAMAPKPIKPTKKNINGYVQLPVHNELYYIYGSEKANTGDGGRTPDYQRYGKPALVKMFQDVAVQFRDRYPETKLVAGDLNAIAGHDSHMNGIDMDVYAQNRMAADMRGAHRNSASVERSVALGKMFMATKKVDVIFYNDPVVNSRVNDYARKNNLPGRMEPSNSSHEFHFHVRIKAKSGPDDNCAKAKAAKNCF